MSRSRTPPAPPPPRERITCTCTVDPISKEKRPCKHCFAKGITEQTFFSGRRRR